MYDHVVALNSPRLIPAGVSRKIERSSLPQIGSVGALQQTAGFSASGRPYSAPVGGLGVTAPYPAPSIRPRVGSTEIEGVSATDSLEPHWLLELVIQVLWGGVGGGGGSWNAVERVHVNHVRFSCVLFLRPGWRI